MTHRVRVLTDNGDILGDITFTEDFVGTRQSMVHFLPASFPKLVQLLARRRRMDPPSDEEVKQANRQISKTKNKLAKEVGTARNLLKSKNICFVDMDYIEHAEQEAIDLPS